MSGASRNDFTVPLPPHLGKHPALHSPVVRAKGVHCGGSRQRGHAAHDSGGPSAFPPHASAALLARSKSLRSQVWGGMEGSVVPLRNIVGRPSTWAREE